MCSRKALWCGAHCSEAELTAGLCRNHYDLHAESCTYCLRPQAGFTKSWKFCRTAECTHEIYVCSGCVSITGERGLICETCWVNTDKSCIICGQQPAQNERSFLRSCRSCFSAHFIAEENEIVKSESAAYLTRIAEQQTWGGDEPALQLLLLPSSSGSSLPEYSAAPDYLSPSHCRLCLSSVESGRMEEHLREVHEKSSAQYRRDVFQKVLAEWPQRIPAQVLRTRLAAFKVDLCDNNFAELPCASCCRLKRKCKLASVIFPPVDAADPPAWLPWNNEEWLQHRAVWFQGLDDVLNVNYYLDKIFRVSERLAAAQKEVLAFEVDNELTSTFRNVTTASAWLRRVQRWSQNLRRYLRADSVLAPGLADTWWLLYPSSALSRDPHSGDISCLLCKSCRQTFAKVVGKKNKPDVQVPQLARANGMWRGPDPAELAQLSYAEAKVINLARVYVSVKRIFWIAAAMRALVRARRRCTIKKMWWHILRIPMPHSKRWA